MNRMIAFSLILAVCWLAGADAFGQRFGGRGRWQGRRPSEMTDADREAMYDRMVEHYLERFAGDYELTDDQSLMVEARLEKLKAAHKAYVEPLREEFTQTGRELREMFHKRWAGEEVDRERMEGLMRRMREMREGSPLMNRDVVTQEVEAMLPTEQVERGRKRAQKRRDDMRRRWEERRGRRGEGRRGDRDGRGERGDRMFSSSRRDRWDRYCDEFKRRYGLDAGQVATADSILREVKEQRDQYMETYQVDFDALRSIEDRDQRFAAYRELSAPTDALFDHLCERLDRVPTRLQKEAGGSMPEFRRRSRSDSRLRRTTTRPADSTTHPASTTTRPAAG